jgi:DNA-directed RNA polymerase specialized sigma24 family protein
MAQGVRDSLRELMRYTPATNEIARAEAERVHRELTERCQGAACDRENYVSDPDTYLWLAVFNLLDLFGRQSIPDRLQLLRRVDRFMTSLSGSAEQPLSDDAIQAEMRRRFDSLPMEAQAVMQLCQIHEFAPSDIAERVGVPAQDIKELLVQALFTLSAQ